MQHLLHELGNEALDNYIACYERGGVQPRPQLRFIDAEGRACPATAFAGASSRSELADSRMLAGFLGSVLERVSRRFEDGNLEPADLYSDCLLERARRTGPLGPRRATTPQATAR